MLASFILSGSFRPTLARRQSIRSSQKELEKLSQDAQKLRAEIDRLQAHSGSYEKLVRKELGYLRPGEKEVRFVNKQERR